MVATVAFTANGASTDQLTIQNQGTGAGQIGVSVNNVTYGGVTIGTFSGGTNGSSLVVTFNSGSATPQAVQALVDHILYSSSAIASSSKTVTYTLNDGDGTANGGANTGTATATINVTGSDTTSPTVTISHNNSGANQTVTFTFSEAVVGFDLNDVSIVGATPGAFTHVGINGSGQDIYTLALSNATGPGSHTIRVVASGTGTSSWADVAGNPGLGSAVFNLPAGVAGSPINLGFGRHHPGDGVLVTVKIADVPAGLDDRWCDAASRRLLDSADISDVQCANCHHTRRLRRCGGPQRHRNLDQRGRQHRTTIRPTTSRSTAPGSPIFACVGRRHPHRLERQGPVRVLAADRPRHVLQFRCRSTTRSTSSAMPDFTSFADVQAHLADDADGNAVITLGDGQIDHARRRRCRRRLPQTTSCSIRRRSPRTPAT